MVVNAKCNVPAKEPTKYGGFYDGPKGRHGCLFDCKMSSVRFIK